MQGLLSQGPLFIICLVFLLGIVVIVHELGHYWVGRWFGAAAESFSVGFGKPIFETKDKRNTRWRVNWIPLGGFVKFVGESQTAGDVGVVESGPIGRAYTELNPYQRIAVSLAGPVANFILAALIFALILWVKGVQPMTIGVGSVNPDSPAERAGLITGDAFVKIGKRDINKLQDLQVAIALSPNVPTDFVVERGGELLTLVVTPVEEVRENQFGQVVPQSTIGVGLARVGVGEKITYNPVEALGAGIAETGRTLDQTVTMLGRIGTGKMSLHTMSGPVGIGDLSRRAVNMVWAQPDKTRGEKFMDLFWMQLGICAAISVGIGFFNLLPLPVLDGGHVVFNLYEIVTGKTLPEKVQEVSLTFGLILLLGMVVVITFGDIIETGLFSGGAG